MATLPTIGEIARRTGYPVHRVAYVIDSRGVQPLGRAGNARVFTEADVDFVKAELARIDRDRAGGA